MYIKNYHLIMEGFHFKLSTKGLDEFKFHQELHLSELCKMVVHNLRA